MLNYAYAILEVEASLMLQAWGFDPSVGILHADERYRPSLSADLMEPVRPIVDGLVLDLVEERRFRRGELDETREGLCRLGPSLARELAEFSPTMRSALEPHAKRLAQTLVGKAQARGKAAGRRRTRVVTG